MKSDKKRDRQHNDKKRDRQHNDKRYKNNKQWLTKHNTHENKQKKIEQHEPCVKLERNLAVPDQKEGQTIQCSAISWKEQFNCQ